MSFYFILFLFCKLFILSYICNNLSIRWVEKYFSRHVNFAGYKIVNALKLKPTIIPDFTFVLWVWVNIFENISSLWILCARLTIFPYHYVLISWQADALFVFVSQVNSLESSHTLYLLDQAILLRGRYLKALRICIFQYLHVKGKNIYWKYFQIFIQCPNYYIYNSKRKA